MIKINADILIIGGGVAGLWLHRCLNDLGYNAVLIEKAALGGTQTLSSQGIIHGGTKYTLGGVLTGAASAISDMPSRWLSCLAGNGEIDLSATKVLSPHQLMWSSQSLSSKLTSFFSSKVLSGKVISVDQKKLPEPFTNKQFEGALYQLNEPVLDVPSLVNNLAKKWPSRILCGVDQMRLVKNERGGLTAALIDNDSVEIVAKQFVLTAGEGTDGILESLSMQAPKMQRRPLKMVLVKGPKLPALYAHCVGSSAKPIATITSHRHSDGENIWYIGGSVAEQGVGLSDADLIENTKNTLKDILPWIDVERLTWSTHSVNRAEPAQSGLLRPDTSFVKSVDNIHVCWPTKLALTPNLADKVVALLGKQMPLGAKIDDTHLDEQLSSLGVQFNACFSKNLWERSF